MRCNCKDAYGHSPRPDCPYCDGTGERTLAERCQVPGCDTLTTEGVCAPCDDRLAAHRLQAPAEADAPARGPYRVSCPYCGPLGPSEEHNLTCPRYPTSKLTSAEAGEEVERVDGSTNLPIRLEGRARFLEDRGEVKTPGLLREAITALRANAPVPEPVGGEAERAHIAAWLRTNTPRSCGYVTALGVYMLHVADAIERGDHLASGAGDEG
jgi:hypothetical protein